MRGFLTTFDHSALVVSRGGHILNVTQRYLRVSNFLSTEESPSTYIAIPELKFARFLTAVTKKCDLQLRWTKNLRGRTETDDDGFRRLRLFVEESRFIGARSQKFFSITRKCGLESFGLHCHRHVLRGNPPIEFEQFEADSPWIGIFNQIQFSLIIQCRDVSFGGKCGDRRDVLAVAHLIAPVDLISRYKVRLYIFKHV